MSVNIYLFVDFNEALLVTAVWGLFLVIELFLTVDSYLDVDIIELSFDPCEFNPLLTFPMLELSLLDLFKLFLVADCDVLSL